MSNFAKVSVCIFEIIWCQFLIAQNLCMLAGKTCFLHAMCMPNTVYLLYICTIPMRYLIKNKTCLRAPHPIINCEPCLKQQAIGATNY